jgi:hypothetical protein
MKLESSRLIFAKCTNISFHENSSIGSRVVLYGWKDGRDEANSRFLQLDERAWKWWPQNCGNWVCLRFHVQRLVGILTSMVLHPAFEPFSPRCHGFQPFELYDVSVLVPRPTQILKTWVYVFVQHLAQHLSSMGQPTYERNLPRPVKWGL